LQLICELILYAFILPEISRDRDIYDITGNAKILETTSTA